MAESFEKQPPLPESGEVAEDKEEQRILRVIVSRHGPKLTAAGEKNAKATYFDDHVRAGYKQTGFTEQEEGLARVASSPVKRATNTADIYVDELGKTKHRTKNRVHPKESLATPFQPRGEASDQRFAEDLQTIVDMQRNLEPTVRSNVEQKLFGASKEEQEAEIRNRIDMIVLSDLFYDAARPEEQKKFKTSWQELADKFAKRYAGFARHTKLLEKLRSEGSKQSDKESYVQVDVSHSFPITAYLKKYLVFTDGTKARDLSPEEFFGRTGGIIPESGSLQMDYVRGKSKIEQIQVTGEFKPGQRFSGNIDTNALKSTYSHRK